MPFFFHVYPWLRFPAEVLYTSSPRHQAFSDPDDASRKEFAPANMESNLEAAVPQESPTREASIS